jgi:hypothetical protein
MSGRQRNLDIVRLHPRSLAHPWFRWLLLTGWLAGAATIWWDAATGPFTRLFFPPALLLCLIAAGWLLWGYRHILFHFAGGLDEREVWLRARVYRAALGIATVAVLVVWGWTLMTARADNGWHLKEMAYLLPLALLMAPGAAAALVLPADEA